jgi:hypothetical protein
MQNTEMRKYVEEALQQVPEEHRRRGLSAGVGATIGGVAGVGPRRLGRRVYRRRGRRRRRREVRQGRCAMSNLARWWEGRSGGEKLALGIGGALAVVATGGAFAYVVATEGLVVVSGETLVVVGKAATRMLRVRVWEHATNGLRIRRGTARIRERIPARAVQILLTPRARRLSPRRPPRPRARRATGR